jgi:hypothetical protein
VPSLPTADVPGRVVLRRTARNVCLGGFWLLAAVIFFVLGVSFVAGAAEPATTAPAGVALGAAVLLALAGLSVLWSVRTFRRGLVVDGSGLSLRRTASTVQLAWSELAAVDVQPVDGGPKAALRVTTVSGRHWLADCTAQRNNANADALREQVCRLLPPGEILPKPVETRAVDDGQPGNVAPQPVAANTAEAQSIGVLLPKPAGSSADKKPGPFARHPWTKVAVEVAAAALGCFLLWLCYTGEVAVSLQGDPATFVAQSCEHTQYRNHVVHNCTGTVYGTSGAVLRRDAHLSTHDEPAIGERIPVKVSDNGRNLIPGSTGRMIAGIALMVAAAAMIVSALMTVDRAWRKHRVPVSVGFATIVCWVVGGGVVLFMTTYRL